MPKTTESITVVQEKLLEALRVGQDASLDAMRQWVDVFTSIIPKLPDGGTPSTGNVPEWPSVGHVIDFTERLWERQREFNVNLYETLAPVGRSVFGTARTSATRTTQAAEHAAARATTTAKS